jgi:hypothetical protein
MRMGDPAKSEVSRSRTNPPLDYHAGEPWPRITGWVEHLNPAVSSDSDRPICAFVGWSARYFEKRHTTKDPVHGYRCAFLGVMDKHSANILIWHYPARSEHGRR